MTHFNRLGGPASLLLALLVAACGSTTPTVAPASPSPSSASTPPSAAPASPSSAAGSPVPTGSADASALYSGIEAQVEALRGLQAKTAVPREVLDEAALRTFITQSFEKDNPADLVQGTEDLYKGLLLLPDDASLHDLYIDLLTSQVLGLYDDKTQKMYVVSRSGQIGPAEEITYSHEFTHALQDQNFGLRKLVGDAKDQGDRTMARTALVEGDATLLMSLWAQQHLTSAELSQALGQTDPASQAVLARMPDILKDPLEFPYTAGATMAVSAFQAAGGYSGVDALYANPPDSTEQLIHPDKLAAHEKPIPVSFPANLASRLGSGWTVPLQDTFGEHLLDVVLRSAGGVASDVSSKAAAGWGGDRVALVKGPDGATGVVLDTAWDTAADATEFSAALNSVVAKLKAAGRSAAVLTPSKERVVLVTADSDASLSRIAGALGLAG